MLDPAAVPSAPAAPAGPNVLKLLVLIWVRPGRALSAIAQGSAWLWVVPLILALLLLAARSFAAVPGLEREQRARNAAMVAERLAEVPMEYRESLPEEATAVPEPSRMLVLWMPLALGATGILLGWLVRAAVLHVASLALGGRQSYGSIYRTSAWAGFPLLLRDFVQAVYLGATGTAIKGAGLSGLVSAGAASKAVGPISAVSSVAPVTVSASASSAPGVTALLLARIDIYALWYAALLILAVLAAGRLSRGKAFIVMGIYALLSLATAFGSLLTRGFMGG